MSQLKPSNAIYLTPAYLLIGLVMPLFLPFLIYMLIKQRKWKPRLLQGNEAVLAHYPYNIQYVARREGNIVTQEWIISKYLQDIHLNGKSAKDQLQIKRSDYQAVISLNKNGIRETLGGKNYPGKLTYALSPDDVKKRPALIASECDQLINLWQKARLVTVLDYINPVLSRSEFQSADFRKDLIADIKGVSMDEYADLLSLTYSKLDYQKSLFQDDQSTIYEDMLVQLATQGGAKNKALGEYLYEFQLENYRDYIDHPAELDNLLGDKGVHVGGNWFYKGQGHFLTIGKTRGGKGTNLIIPQLLSPECFDGSVISLDIKGTLTAITARYLNEVGKKVVIIDPWKVQDKIKPDHGLHVSSFNPLDALDPEDPNFTDDCDEMADLLVSFNENETQDSHWSDRAKQWVSYYLMWMMTGMDEEDRHLYKLREMFTFDEEQRIDLFTDMIARGENDLIIQNGKQLADMFKTAPKEAQSILSTVLRAIDLFKSPVMQKATSSSDFDLKEITSGEYYVFVIIPPDRVKTHFRWLRAVLGGCITAVTRNANKRVLMILDEFPSLGKLDLAKKGMGTMAEYNLSLWVIAQGIDQLKEIYGDGWQTFFTNSAVSTWIGIEGLETAEFLSRSFGTRHVKYKPDKVILDEIRTGNVHPPENYEIPAQTSQQIRQFDGVYTLVSGYPATQYSRTPYYESERMAERADPNPYYNPEE